MQLVMSLLQPRQPPPPPPRNLGCRQVIPHEQNERTKKNQCKILMAPVAAGSNPESLKSWICWEAGDSRLASTSNCRRRMDGEAITCKALPDTCKAVTCRASLAAQKTNKGCLGFLSHAGAQFARASHAQDSQRVSARAAAASHGTLGIEHQGWFYLLSACKPATPL